MTFAKKEKKKKGGGKVEEKKSRVEVQATRREGWPHHTRGSGGGDLCTGVKHTY